MLVHGPGPRRKERGGRVVNFRSGGPRANQGARYMYADYRMYQGSRTSRRQSADKKQDKKDKTKQDEGFTVVALASAAESRPTTLQWPLGQPATTTNGSSNGAAALIFLSRG